VFPRTRDGKQLMTLREERMIENEKLFRTANERLRTHVEKTAARDGRIPFLCECTDDTCMARVELNRAEYTRVRADENHFVIAPAHPMMESERIVAQNERFWIVEKPAE
jgi:hypothetical protein